MYCIFPIDIYIYTVYFVRRCRFCWRNILNSKSSWSEKLTEIGEMNTRPVQICTIYFHFDLYRIWGNAWISCNKLLSQIDPKKTGAASLNWITRTKSVISLFIATSVTGIRCVFEAYLRWVGLKHHVPPFLKEISTYPVMQRLPMTRHVRHASRTWNCESFEKSSETM